MKLLRTASALLMVLGVGHLTIVLWSGRASVEAWFASGLWSAVPLAQATATAEPLQSMVTFWAGPASFAVPLFMLGVLTWHLAGRGVPVPAGIGWTIAAWCLVCAVILAPSPFYLGILAGLLIVVAARRPRSTAGQ